MRIAIVFVGIVMHVKRKHVVPIMNYSYETNYRCCVDNNIKFLLPKKFKFDIFASINNINQTEATLFRNAYNISDTNMLINKNPSTRETKYLNSLELFSHSAYDFYLFTRPDIEFCCNVFDFIDIKMFNIISILESKDLTDDNFYAFPRHMLPIFKEAVLLKKNNHKEFLPYLNQHDIPIHYIRNENRPVGELSFFKIKRLNVDRPPK